MFSTILTLSSNYFRNSISPLVIIVVTECVYCEVGIFDIVGTVYHLVIYTYEVQQDTQCGLMSKFSSALMLALHVSDLIGPSSGTFCTSCIRRLWYVVIRVLLYTSSRYEIVGRTVCGLV